MDPDDQITEIVEFIRDLLEHPNLKIYVNLIRLVIRFVLGRLQGRGTTHVISEPLQVFWTFRVSTPTISCLRHARTTTGVVERPGRP